VLAFFGAAGLAVAGVAGAGSATAGSTAAPPTYQYSSAESAIGVQVALQRNPDFSSLPDPFDAELPDSEAQLNSFGTSVADGHIVNLNGLGGIPGLICLAAGPSNCAKIPVGQLTGGVVPSFPPPDPVDAHATYPHDPAAKAPLLGSKVAQAAIDTNGFALDAGAADATAQQYATTTFAREQNIAIPGGLTVGSATTSTSQTAAADGLTTTAVVHLSNIAIGGTALTIDHLTTTSTVVVRPGKPPQDTTSTVLSGVKSAGLNATVDGSGIHINGNGLPASLIAQVQDAVTKTFAAAGIKVSLSKVSHTDDANGHTVAAYGLILTYDRNVNNPPPLDSVTVSPQTLGLPCPQIIPPGSGLDPCSGVSFSLNGVYHGQVALGQVGSVSLAQPNSLAGGVPPAGGAAGPGGTSSAPGGTGNGVGPGGVHTPPGSPQAQSSGSPPSGAPVVAGQQRAVANELAGVGHRLAWLFPLFAICVFGLIGRFRTPARLPGPK
jgi:hypothetical protein